MGWADCGKDSKGRPIGYAFEAECDHPGCDEKIDRGLDYACDGMHGSTEYGCEGYFCYRHLTAIFPEDFGLDEYPDPQGNLCLACAALNEKEFAKEAAPPQDGRGREGR